MNNLTLTSSRAPWKNDLCVEACDEGGATDAEGTRSRTTALVPNHACVPLDRPPPQVGAVAEMPLG